MVKPKKCRHCKAEFIPVRPMQTACSVPCAVALSIARSDKALRVAEIAEKRATRAAIQRIKPRSQWLKEAQTAFNAWIRARDADQPCISCGRHHDGQYHAGHYLSTGARPELRFYEPNVHKQCQPCNTHLHGNLVLYRVALIKKVGIDEVEWLEGPHDPAKWTVEDLKEIKRYFSAKVKAAKDSL
jgi:hypothetical protein